MPIKEAHEGLHQKSDIKSTVNSNLCSAPTEAERRLVLEPHIQYSPKSARHSSCRIIFGVIKGKVLPNFIYIGITLPIEKMVSDLLETAARLFGLIPFASSLFSIRKNVTGTSAGLFVVP